MVKRKEIVEYCNDLLDVKLFQDYCPNGLQVEGKEFVSKIISGVTASQALIDQAIELRADLILVHHGFFWRGENPVVCGMKKNRLKALLTEDINLLAYHLPLDAHKSMGNNVLLAEKLGIRVEQFFADNDIAILGLIREQTGIELAQTISTVLSRQVQHIDVERNITKVALCTGAAQSYIEQAIEAGADAFISGEISENTWHFAKENNIHYFAAGHHATERYGVQALGEHLAETFNLEHHYVEVYNPV